jgi:hypothetical protein
MLTKVCTKCGVEKDLVHFYTAKKGKYGKSASCKGCVAERYFQTKEAIKNYQSAYRLRNKKTNAEYQQLYYLNNKQSLVERQKLYNQKNKETISLNRKVYYSTNKEHFKAQKKIYRIQNIDKHNASNARRRALKLQATPPWVDEDAIVGMYRLAAIFNRTGLDLHVDHIVPLNSGTVCGLHCESNLQLLSSTDNISKGNRWWPDMW